MTATVDAIFEDGVLRPLVALPLREQQRVRVTIESDAQNNELSTCDEPSDPLAGIRVDTGIVDLAENFDDYRLGRREP